MACHSREVNSGMADSTGDTVNMDKAPQRGLAVTEAERDAALCALYDGRPINSYTLAVLREVGTTFGRRARGAQADRPWDSASRTELRRLVARDWSAKAMAAFLSRSEASVVGGLLLIGR